MEDPSPAEPQPGPLNYVLGFTLVGIAWGLTTPFIRRAARDHHPRPHPILDTDAVKRSWFKAKVYGAFFAVVDLLRNPRYAVPLLINLTGSVWFFLLIGQAGESALLFSPSLLAGHLFVHHDANGVIPSSHRIEPDGTDCEHAGILVHRYRGLVGRRKGHQQEYVPSTIPSCWPGSPELTKAPRYHGWYGLVSDGDWTVRPEQEHLECASYCPGQPGLHCCHVNGISI